MSGRELRRGIAPLALFGLAALGCGASEQASTLPSEDREANPSVHGVLPAPTPGGLHQHVVEKARTLAARDHQRPDTALPRSFAALDYTAYRSIRFRPEAALWRGHSPFEVQLLPRGSLFTEAVLVHVVDDDGIETLDFDPGLFTFDGPTAETPAADRARLGYSGFRVHFPLNAADIADEVVVFQGASYFRLVGPGQAYGLSSRGLGIDIGEYEGEEFPRFTEFWLVRPERDDRSLVVHALLESPSVTGAYRFVLEPEANTELEVDARLFARGDVGKLGVAPLSSMFLHGPTGTRVFDDFRPEVHDSDGLLMHTSGDEWIWRPLSNRRELRVTALRDGDPRGYGLAQRARAFGRYLDVEASYHRRPSQWVEVMDGDWGVGGVELLEAPTDSEFSDNIAVAWVPDTPFRAGDERRYRYRLSTFDHRLAAQPLAQVERTGIGWDALPGQAAPPPRRQRRFIVDFTNGPEGWTSPEEGVRPVLDVSAGAVSDVTTTRLPEGAGWRVSFRLVPEGTLPADMRLHLAGSDRRLSETWSYVWYPDAEH